MRMPRVVTTLLREFAATAVLLVGVSFLVFTIVHFAPGDPAAILPIDALSAPEPPRTSPNVTLVPQYLEWLGRAVTGDFGASIRTGLPVADDIARVGLNTLYLTLASLLISVLVAIFLAVLSAHPTRASFGRPVIAFTYVLSSLPLFWLGYVAIDVCTRYFGFFPLGFGFSQQWSWARFAVPALVLGVGSGAVGEMARHMRVEILRVLEEDYIRNARAKGASVLKYAFKEAFVLPVTQILASKVPFVLGGAVIVEQIFNWPGLGRMTWQAAQDRDFPVILAIAVVTAVFVRLAALMSHLVHVLVNPQFSQR